MFRILAESALLGCGLFCLRIYFRRTRFPPGPRPLPLIGNVLDIPLSSPWKKIRLWTRVYGNLIYVKIFSEGTLFINSYDVAADLLEKRAAIYSSRPGLVVTNELQGWDYMASLMPSCHELKKQRQILLRFLQPSALGQYNSILTNEVHKMLYKTLSDPEKFETYIRNLAGATIVKVAYGYDIKPEDDPYVDLAEKALESITDSTRSLVNFFPSLKYVPDWFPGTGFKQQAKIGRKLAHDVLNQPFMTGKEKILHGQAFPSVMSEMLGNNVDTKGEAVDEELIKAITSVMYIAGSDTTVSFNLSFVLAMVLYPEVQKRGQEEVDRLVGKGVLPTINDLNNLPYVNAIYYEVLRWNPTTPFSLPHSTTEDDTYNGYSIPANTTVIPNVWAMTREYPEPEIFKPERFLDAEDPTRQPPRNPELYAFGFGRRKCPGRFFAENLVKLTIASFFAVCNIEKAIGEDGLPITPLEDYSSDIISHPKSFRCKITPRMPEYTKLLASFVEIAE